MRLGKLALGLAAGLLLAGLAASQPPPRLPHRPGGPAASPAAPRVGPAAAWPACSARTSSSRTS
jgi:hypothetical protein